MRHAGRVAERLSPRLQMLPQTPNNGPLQPFPQFTPLKGPWWVVVLAWLAYVLANGRFLPRIVLAIGTVVTAATCAGSAP